MTSFFGVRLSRSCFPKELCDLWCRLRNKLETQLRQQKWSQLAKECLECRSGAERSVAWKQGAGSDETDGFRGVHRTGPAHRTVGPSNREGRSILLGWSMLDEPARQDGHRGYRFVSADFGSERIHSSAPSAARYVVDPHKLR